MNERIKKLAEQAFFDEPTSQPSDKMYTFSDHKMEKFAELIVRECADVLVTEMNRLDGLDRVMASQTMDTAQVLIKKHFGVKE